MKIKLEWNGGFFTNPVGYYNKKMPKIEIFSNELQMDKSYTYSKKRKFCCIAIFKNSKYLTLKEYEAYRRTL